MRNSIHIKSIAERIEPSSTRSLLWLSFEVGIEFLPWNWDFYFYKSDLYRGVSLRIGPLMIDIADG